MLSSTLPLNALVRMRPALRSRIAESPANKFRGSPGAKSAKADWINASNFSSIILPDALAETRPARRSRTEVRHRINSAAN